MIAPRSSSSSTRSSALLWLRFRPRGRRGVQQSDHLFTHRRRAAGQRTGNRRRDVTGIGARAQAAPVAGVTVDRAPAAPTPVATFRSAAAEWSAPPTPARAVPARAAWERAARASAAWESVAWAWAAWEPAARASAARESVARRGPAVDTAQFNFEASAQGWVAQGPGFTAAAAHDRAALRWCRVARRNADLRSHGRRSRRTSGSHARRRHRTGGRQPDHVPCLSARERRRRHRVHAALHSGRPTDVHRCVHAGDHADLRRLEHHHLAGAHRRRSRRSSRSGCRSAPLAAVAFTGTVYVDSIGW